MDDDAAQGGEGDDLAKAATRLADFQVVNEIYGKVFHAAPPARATVQVAALPRGSKVEIDAIALAR